MCLLLFHDILQLHKMDRNPLSVNKFENEYFCDADGLAVLCRLIENKSCILFKILDYTMCGKQEEIGKCNHSPLVCIGKTSREMHCRDSGHTVKTTTTTTRHKYQRWRQWQYHTQQKAHITPLMPL